MQKRWYGIKNIKRVFRYQKDYSSVLGACSGVCLFIGGLLNVGLGILLIFLITKPETGISIVIIGVVTTVSGIVMVSVVFRMDRWIYGLKATAGATRFQRSSGANYKIIEAEPKGSSQVRVLCKVDIGNGRKKNEEFIINRNDCIELDVHEAVKYWFNKNLEKDNKVMEKIKGYVGDNDAFCESLVGKTGALVR